MLFDLTVRIGSTLFPLIAVVSGGAIYGRLLKPDFRVANMVNMDVFVPALVFTILVNGNFRVVEMAELAAATAALVLLCGLAARLVARIFKWPITAYVPSLMFRNSGNIGLPIAAFAFGEEALPAATIVFLASNTLHFTLGSRMLSPGASLLQVLKIPVVWVSAVALCLNLVSFKPPPVISLPIEMLGQISIPLMLFGLGIRLQNADLREWKIGLAAGLAAPIIGVLCVLLVRPFIDLPPLQLVALLIYAALPPAVLNFMFAERFAQYPAKVASIIAISHMVALMSVPLMLAYTLTKIAPMQ